jgi:hypothetical protein
LICVDQRLHAPQIGEWRMDRDFHCVKILLLEEIRQLLNTLKRFVVVVVHFPIAADDGLTIN